ncbi:amidohydrolase family protein [Sphingopyxis sp. MWB1]|uniref:amidohydrolase family protein n=1 Tax=Sphingopyxis sp. MWB1 TaxID=1537715 RepID=UPI000519FB04|nr:amidohydrolase family protein [Sphingopyxis sp. MWB1]
METDIAFVDAHVHFWDLDRLRYPWLTPPFDEEGPNGNVAAIASNYLLDDYLADAAQWNVKGCVHIDAGADAAQALGETEWLEAMASDHGLPSAIVAFAPLDDPGIERLLERQAAHGRVRGIRQILNWHPDPARSYTPRDLSGDERWREGFGLLGKYGLSFDLQCYAGQMPGLAPLIERHPGIPVIVNHMGMPVMSDPDGITDWRRGMQALATLPHVSVKISGMGFIYRDWTAQKIAPLVEEVIDRFGPGRCMFASDTPTDKLFAPFDYSLRAYHRIAAQYSRDEQHDLFGRNADRIYRLNLDI